MYNRTEAYFEYPSAVAMLLREIRYGISLGLTSIVISPFGVDDFTYHVGNIIVSYSTIRVEVQVRNAYRSTA